MNAALLLSLALSLALPVLVMARLASLWSHDWVDEPERPDGRHDGLGLLTDGIFSPCLRADLSSFGFGLASDEKLLVIGICLNWHTLVLVALIWPPRLWGAGPRALHRVVLPTTWQNASKAVQPWIDVPHTHQGRPIKCLKWC